MKSLLEILEEHSKKYPLMEPRDAVKLIYQNEFGGGHIIKDEKNSLCFLEEEYEGIDKNKTDNISDNIGNGYIRLNLTGIDIEKLPLEYINKIFIQSSTINKGSTESFEEKLEELKKAVKRNLFKFDSKEIEGYLEEYRKSGMNPVSHSEGYKNAYDPHYRVIDERFNRLIDIIIKIIALNKTKENIVIAIDGGAASGKSTMARHLGEIFNGNVIHMDDFFLPAELRTEERYSEAGGNVHYERFNEEVVKGLESRLDFTYKVFDCSKMDYTKVNKISPKKITIIEGAYSLLPKIQIDYDLKVFSKVEEEEQKARIIERNGEKAYEMFKSRWIPLENKYFKSYDVENRVDIKAL